MGKRVILLITYLLVSGVVFIAWLLVDGALESGSGAQYGFVNQGFVNPVSANSVAGPARGYVTIPPDATATPTPFQPVPPTPTTVRGYVYAAVETLSPTPTPIVEIPTPTAMSIIPTGNPAAGRVNLLLLGTDQRSDPGFRTDVIVLVSINPADNTVSVISFPRDLYVTIPGWQDQRINTAFSAGGFNTIAATFQYNFHVRPQYYFLTNFEGFANIINDLDGIAVDAAAPLRDKCDLPDNDHGYCSVEPGKVVMDGKTALWYVRSRHSTSDFDRTRRAQEVLYAMFTRMMKFDALTKLPDLYTQYRSSVETNMTIADMLPLLSVANAVRQDPSRIRRYSVGPGYVSDMVTPEGAMVLQPNLWAIQGLIYQALNGQ